MTDKTETREEQRQAAIDMLERQEMRHGPSGELKAIRRYLESPLPEGTLNESQLREWLHERLLRYEAGHLDYEDEANVIRDVLASLPRFRTPSAKPEMEEAVVDRKKLRLLRTLAHEARTIKPGEGLSGFNNLQEYVRNIIVLLDSCVIKPTEEGDE